MYSQEITTASGGESTGSGGTSTYSVGQVFYTTNSESSGSVAEGIHQAYEFVTLSNLSFSYVDLKAITYPNPTTDYIVLKVMDSALEFLQYTLFDLTGKSIQSGAVNTANTQISMQHLSIGMYLLKVTQKKRSVKTFKILKKQ
tara:strand:- start:490 stop:918 length:429 start_codon:yes stop_codon:yes gene_type:complete